MTEGTHVDDHMAAAGGDSGSLEASQSRVAVAASLPLSARPALGEDRQELSTVFQFKCSAAKLVRLDEPRSFRTGVRPGRASVCAASMRD